jgi:hypothetical protein
MHAVSIDAALAAAQAAILVEGRSDQAAVETVAQRCGRSLEADGVCVVRMGGATNIGSFLAALGPRGLGLRIAGLCDAGEEGHFCRALERAGLGAGLSRAGLEALGFYVCTADLEDELIRALGFEAVEEIIAAQGQLRSFRTFQRQPAQQGRSLDRQLRRFLGSGSGRKIRYAGLFAGALVPGRVPRPLERVLAHV